MPYDGNRESEFEVVEHVFEDRSAFTVVPLNPANGEPNLLADIVRQHSWRHFNLYKATERAVLQTE